MRATNYKLILVSLCAGALFILPVMAGLLGTWLPALGYLPSIGARQISVEPILAVFAHPSSYSSIQATLSSALLATGAAFVISQWLCMQLYNSNSWSWIKRSIGLLLAVPHLAFGIGFAFLISPSGWVMRLLSPGISGFNVPPDWLIINDSYALSLTLVLVLKEIPFFLLMSLAAMGSFDVAKTLQVAASLGYSRGEAWLKLVFVQMYPQLRLPLYAVLSYSLSVVDLSIILGPTSPPTLAVLINQWYGDADTDFRLLGAAGASLLLILVTVLLGLIFALEKLCSKIAQGWLLAGPVRYGVGYFAWGYRKIAKYTVIGLWASTLLTLAVLLLWSVAQQWRFPLALPSKWSLKYWQLSWQQLPEPLFNTALVGFCSAAIAVSMVIAILHWQSQSARSVNQQSSNSSQLLLWLIYLPMLVPQVSFLFGIQVLLVGLGLDGKLASLVWAHLIFVLPYCYLTLAKVFLQFDNRFLQQAMILSQSRWKSFWMIKMPMLFKPIAFSFAISFAVSVSQYLPTLYVAGGRFNTITTETVALATGADDRISASFALWQFWLPLLVFVTATAIPQWCFRRRKGL